MLALSIQSSKAKVRFDMQHKGDLEIFHVQVMIPCKYGACVSFDTSIVKKMATSSYWEITAYSGLDKQVDFTLRAYNLTMTSRRTEIKKLRACATSPVARGTRTTSTCFGWTCFTTSGWDSSLTSIFEIMRFVTTSCQRGQSSKSMQL